MTACSALPEARDGGARVVPGDAHATAEIHQLEGSLEAEGAAEILAVGLLRHVPARGPRADA